MSDYDPARIQNKGAQIVYRVEDLEPLALRDLVESWDALCASPGFAGKRITELAYDTTKYELRVKFL